MLHAIGKEGENIRQYVQCETTADLNAQCQDGEIAVAADQIINGKILDGKIVPNQLTDAQITEEKWNDIRIQRNSILDSNRWTFAADSPLTTDNQAQWVAYFKALNRITIDFSDPDKVVWPTQPSLVYATSASSS